MNDLTVKYGQPVLMAGTKDVLLVVGQDSEDPNIYYGIPEKQVNTHVRVDLIPFCVEDVKPLRAFTASVGDLTSYKGEPAKVLSVDMLGSGRLVVKTASCAHVICNAEETTVPSTCECRPIKICAGCGSYIDHDGDEEACAHIHAQRAQLRAAAGTTTPVSKDTERLAVVAALNTLLAAISIDDFKQPAPEPEALEEADELPTLEFGERVFKPAAAAVAGTIIGRNAACHLVAWDNNDTPEQCWGFELRAVKAHVTPAVIMKASTREVNLDE